MVWAEVIVNAGSGSVLAGETERSLRERFIAHGVKANVTLAESWRKHDAPIPTCRWLLSPDHTGRHVGFVTRNGRGELIQCLSV